jgi:hypothetical protein
MCIGVAKNNLYTSQERSSANIWAQHALTHFQQDQNITDAYHKLLNGKWNHIMDQTSRGYSSWQQPVRNSLPPLGYTQEVGNAVVDLLRVTCEAEIASIPGDDEWHALSSNALTLRPIYPYGPPTKWIDVFSRGTESHDLNISTKSYATATPSSGSLAGSSIPKVHD